MLNVRLLGKFSAHYGERVIEGLGTRRPQELFCYLLLHRRQQHSREALASLLWSDVSTAQSKKCLRHVLWQLQTALSTCETSDSASILLIEPNWLQINPQVDLWLDVEIFERAWATTRSIPGRKLDDCQVQKLKEAIALYLGDLLEGNYEDWCQRERERLRSLYLAMLSKLLDYCVARDEYEEGLAYGTRILHEDRTHEATYRQLMRLHYKRENRSDALRLYRECAEALQEEYCATPDESTQMLYRYILNDCNSQQKPPPAVSPDLSQRPTRLLLFDALSCLKQIQESQQILQYRIEQKLSALEQALHPHQNAQHSSVDHP